jgi:hypothetical protein
MAYVYPELKVADGKGHFGDISVGRRTLKNGGSGLKRKIDVIKS